MFNSMAGSEAEAVGAAVPYLDADPTRDEHHGPGDQLYH